MSSAYYDYIRDLLKNSSGLIVSPDKLYLIETRLMPVARAHGFKTIDEMVQAQKAKHDPALELKIVEAMNTHESLFFRDQAPFTLFQDKLLPELLTRRAMTRRIRIWCAACSSGQEPYSLAMLLKEHTEKLAGWTVEIIASDISHSILKRAQDGIYSQFEVQRGLPVKMLVKHFTQDGEYWRLNKDVRDMVTFRHYNLLDKPVGLGRFDVIFCRNVLIYFDLETKSQVLSSMSQVLHDDGVLFLGSAESTIGLTEDFWPVEAGRGVYKHTDGPPSIVE